MNSCNNILIFIDGKDRTLAQSSSNYKLQNNPQAMDEMMM